MVIAVLHKKKERIMERKGERKMKALDIDNRSEQEK